MEISSAVVVYIVKVLFQFIPMVIGIVTIIITSRKVYNGNGHNNELTQPENSNAITTVISLIPVAIFILVAITSIPGVNVFTNPLIINGLVNSFVISIISCVLVIILSLCLAYGMVVDNKVVLISNSIFILLCGNIMGQYIQMKSLFLVNTYVPIIILNCLYAHIGAYFIYFAVGGINKISFGNFFVKSLPVVVTMLGISFAKFYSNIIDPMIYIRNRAYYPVSVMLREILISGRSIGGDHLVVSTVPLLIIPVVIGVSSIWISIFLSVKQNRRVNI